MRYATLGLLLTALCACSSGGGSDNELEAAYPTELAITSPFATGNVVEGLTKPDRLRAQTDDETIVPVSFDSRLEEIRKRILAEDLDSCRFDIRLFSPLPPATCYGPVINYTNHPDFVDNPDITNCETPGSLECPDGQLPPGDVGIWKENEPATGEACTAAKMNTLVAGVQAQVDLALDLTTAMLCAANVRDEDRLPEVGETADFKAVLTEALGTGESPFTITEAGMTAETVDSSTAYITHIKASASFTSPSGPAAIEVDLNLKHVVLDEAAGTYRGRLWYTVAGELPMEGGGCRTDLGAPAPPKLLALSVAYSKASDTDLKYRLQRATYCSETAAPFNADFAIDPSNKYDPKTQDGWVNDYNDGVFNLNPTDGSGRFSYAWQAGAMDGNTRVFLSGLDAGEDGVLSGCGYFGFGPDAADSNVGTIDGMICNWAGPGNIRDPMTPKVQRQCVQYDADAKHYVTDTDAGLNITYAPANSCDSAGDPFTFGTVGDPPVTEDVTNDLLSIETMLSDLTLPEKPPGI